MAWIARRPSTVLGVLFAVLLAVAAIVNLLAQDRGRDRLLDRFEERVRAPRTFTQSALDESIRGIGRTATNIFATARPTPEQLEAFGKALGGPNVAIFDAGGRLLAKRPDDFQVDPEAPHVRAAVAGRGATSDLEAGPGGPSTYYAVPFTTKFGPRAVVQNAGDPASLDGFLRPVLDESRLGGGRAYLIDGAGRVLSGPGGLGEPLADPALRREVRNRTQGAAGDTHFVAGAVPNTRWRVVMTAADNELFAPVSGLNRWVSWGLLAAFALTAGLAVWLVRSLHRREVELDAANAAKTEMIASLSHELRSPLNGLLGFTSLLHEGRIPAAEREEALGHVLTTGRHLEELINGLLDDAVTEAGHGVLRPEDTDLRELVAESKDAVRALAARRRMEIETEVDERLPAAVRLDPLRVRQVLYNFLSNALKYAPEGTTVRLRARSRGRGGLRFEVGDEGPGIARRDVARLWTSYGRLGGESAEGTGLGLSVTKRIAALHGGRVGVETGVGRGSNFWFEIALVEATATPRTAGSSTAT